MIEAVEKSVLSVVIPAYNEEDGIAEIVERVLAVGPALERVGVVLVEQQVSAIDRIAMVRITGALEYDLIGEFVEGAS